MSREPSGGGGVESRRGAGHVKAAVSAAVLVLLPVLIITAAAGVRRSQAEGPAESRPPASAARATPTPEGTCEVLLTLKAEGFEPVEVLATAGACLLSVDNRSGVREVTLRLSREGGAHVRDIRVPPAAVDWGEEVEFTPGPYALTAVGRPEWSCRIVVQ